MNAMNYYCSNIWELGELLDIYAYMKWTNRQRSGSGIMKYFLTQFLKNYNGTKKKSRTSDLTFDKLSRENRRMRIC